MIRPDVNWFAVTAYGLGALGVAAFIARYLRTRWRATPMGRGTMHFAIAILINMLCAISVITFGEYPHVQVVRSIGAVAVLPAGWWLLRNLIVEQRRARRRRATPADGLPAPTESPS